MKSWEDVVYKSSWCGENSPPLSDWSKEGKLAWTRSGMSSSPIAGIRSGRLLELLALSCGMGQLTA